MWKQFVVFVFFDCEQCQFVFGWQIVLLGQLDQVVGCVGVQCQQVFDVVVLVEVLVQVCIGLLQGLVCCCCLFWVSDGGGWCVQYWVCWQYVQICDLLGDRVSMFMLVLVIVIMCFYCVDSLWFLVIMVQLFGSILLQWVFLLIIGLMVKVMLGCSISFWFGWLQCIICGLLWQILLMLWLQYLCIMLNCLVLVQFWIVWLILFSVVFGLIVWMLCYIVLQVVLIRCLVIIDGVLM